MIILLVALRGHRSTPSPAVAPGLHGRKQGIGQVQGPILHLAGKRPPLRQEKCHPSDRMEIMRRSSDKSWEGGNTIVGWFFLEILTIHKLKITSFEWENHPKHQETPTRTPRKQQRTKESRPPGHLDVGHTWGPERSSGVLTTYSLHEC